MANDPLMNLRRELGLMNLSHIEVCSPQLSMQSIDVLFDLIYSVSHMTLCLSRLKEILQVHTSVFLSLICCFLLINASISSLYIRRVCEPAMNVVVHVLSLALSLS